MEKFNQESFDNFILESGIIGFFKEPIKLKSGQLSDWYVNWRTVAEDVYLIDKLTDFVLSFVISHKLEVDTFYGVPEGASKLGVLTQYKWAKAQKNFGKGSHILAMGRGKEKDHGNPKDRSFLAIPKGRTIVIEDVTSTGSSLVATIEKLRSLGINVVAAIALTNRSETPINMGNIPYFAMSNANNLLEKCKK